MTGIQLAREIGQLCSRLPILMYTGYRDDITDADLSAAGVNRLISKPVDVSELKLTVAKLLQY